jgi:hypothetical protein
MKYTKIDAPIVNTQQVKINGEFITIQPTYDGIRIRGDYDRLTVYLCSFEPDTEWAFATIELDDTEAIDGGIRAEYDIYDGYDIDAAIEYVLEQAKE